METGKTLHELSDHQSAQDRRSKGVYCVAWSRDGRLLSAGKDGIARVWNGSAYNLLIRLEGHDDEILTAQWHPANDRLVATASRDHTVRIWNTETGVELTRLEGHTDTVSVARWSPTGRHIATASEGESARLWSLEPDLNLAVVADRASPDGSAGIFEPVNTSAPPTRGNDPVVIRPYLVLLGHSEPVIDLAWDARGRRLATAGDDGTGRVWNIATGRELALLVGHQGDLHGIAWNRGGTLVTTGGHDGTLRIWAVEAGSEEASFALGAAAHSAVWDTHSRRLAVAGHSNTVYIWDTKEGSQGGLAEDLETPTSPRVGRLALSGHRSEVLSAAWQPAGERVATGSRDSTVRLWNAISGEALATLHGHQSAVREVRWSGDGQQLASAGFDGHVRLFKRSLERLIDLACRRAVRNLTVEEWDLFLDIRYRKTCPSFGTPRMRPR